MNMNAILTKVPDHEKCSVLLNEVRDNIRRLKEYGLRDDEIASALRGDVALPLLRVTNNCKIYLSTTNKEIKMEPLVKAVYLLFLKHPEGIMFKGLPEYRIELSKIYGRLKPWGLTDRAIQSIDDVTNPLLNSINEKCARILKVFLDVLGTDLAAYYYIKGERGELKKIALPQDLIIWE
jgi:hypothetical protein